MLLAEDPVLWWVFSYWRC